MATRAQAPSCHSVLPWPPPPPAAFEASSQEREKSHHSGRWCPGIFFSPRPGWMRAAARHGKSIIIRCVTTAFSSLVHALLPHCPSLAPPPLILSLLLPECTNPFPPLLHLSKRTDVAAWPCASAMLLCCTRPPARHAAAIPPSAFPSSHLIDPFFSFISSSPAIYAKLHAALLCVS